MQGGLSATFNRFDSHADRWQLVSAWQPHFSLTPTTTRRFGEKLLARIKHQFRLWHRRDQTPAERWQRDSERAQQAVHKVARRPPCRSEAQNLAQRLAGGGNRTRKRKIPACLLITI
jgi:hypothetical protein